MLWDQWKAEFSIENSHVIWKLRVKVSIHLLSPDCLPIFILGKDFICGLVSSSILSCFRLFSHCYFILFLHFIYFYILLYVLHNDNKDLNSEFLYLWIDSHILDLFSDSDKTGI